MLSINFGAVFTGGSYAVAGACVSRQLARVACGDGSGYNWGMAD